MPEQKNPFMTRRNIEHAPLHVTENFNEKPMAKSFSLCTIDTDRIHTMKEQLKTRSRRRLNDSLIVRVALAYLDESIQRGGVRFEEDIRRLIGENR